MYIELHDSRESRMTASLDDTHDLVVNAIARTRFPFPGQTTWPADYVTLTNAPIRQRSIPVEAGEYFPDIVIHDGTGRIREVGEVEMALDPQNVTLWRAGSLTADDETSAKVRHFFFYVPAGMEEAAKALLDAHAVSYAGVRGFTLEPSSGLVKIVPYVTPGDAYDHQITDLQAA